MAAPLAPPVLDGIPAVVPAVGMALERPPVPAAVAMPALPVLPAAGATGAEPPPPAAPMIGFTFPASPPQAATAHKIAAVHGLQ
jgi:hypothetical protein